MSDITNSMYGEVNIDKYCQVEQPLEVIIGTTSTQDIEVNVIGCGNNMFGSINVIPPPLTQLNLLSMNDTFVRSDISTLSYGNYQSMYTGPINQSYMANAFVGFNLNNIPKGMVIKKAILKLKSTINTISSNVQIYSLNKQWEENNTTWVNKPSYVQLITSVDLSKGNDTLEIDMLDYVNDCYKNGTVDNGFEIKDSIGRSFYTKESNYSPELEISYYDPTSLVDTNYMDFEVTIIANNNNDQDLETDIKYSYNIDNNDQAIETTISKPDQLIEATLLGKTEQDFEVTIQENGVLEQDFEVTMSKPQQPIEVLIGTTSTQEAEVTITRTNNSTQDIEVSMIVSGNSTQDIEASMITSLTKSNDQAIETIISKQDQLIETEMIVPDDSTQDFEVTIYSNGNNDQDMEVITSKPDQLIETTIASTNDQDMETSIILPGSATQEIEVNIIRPGDSYQNTEVNVQNSLTKSNDQAIEVNIYKIENNDQDLEVDIETNLTKSNDQEMEINLYNTSPNDQEFEVNMIVENINEIDIETDIVKFRGYGFIM